MRFELTSSGGHFVGPSETILGNFGREHYGEHSCEIVLNLD